MLLDQPGSGAPSLALGILSDATGAYHLPVNQASHPQFSRIVCLLGCCWLQAGPRQAWPSSGSPRWQGAPLPPLSPLSYLNLRWRNQRVPDPDPQPGLDPQCRLHLTSCCHVRLLRRVARPQRSSWFLLWGLGVEFINESIWFSRNRGGENTTRCSIWCLFCKTFPPSMSYCRFPVQFLASISCSPPPLISPLFFLPSRSRLKVSK